MRIAMFLSLPFLVPILLGIITYFTTKSKLWAAVVLIATVIAAYFLRGLIPAHWNMLIGFVLFWVAIFTYGDKAKQK